MYIDEFVLTAVFATPVVDLSLSREGAGADVDQIVSFGGIVVGGCEWNQEDSHNKFQHILIW